MFSDTYSGKYRIVAAYADTAIVELTLDSYTKDDDAEATKVNRTMRMHLSACDWNDGQIVEMDSHFTSDNASFEKVDWWRKSEGDSKNEQRRSVKFFPSLDQARKEKLTKQPMTSGEWQECLVGKRWQFRDNQQPIEKVVALELQPRAGQNNSESYDAILVCTLIGRMGTTSRAHLDTARGMKYVGTAVVSESRTFGSIEFSISAASSIEADGTKGTTKETPDTNFKPHTVSITVLAPRQERRNESRLIPVRYTTKGSQDLSLWKSGETNEIKMKCVER